MPESPSSFGPSLMSVFIFLSSASSWEDGLFRHFDTSIEIHLDSAFLLGVPKQRVV
ncbi:hypothetical protein CPB83DRAFT_848979 [Crepidotus variabilis]|uniref:Uncharacterized protein n=1 Tax=Crepidotus variabilis TaxID=179855 RepID=A0A9P6JRZ9_9AGAR|nr:hypothetical protein CPB83DRAFT_848979 [Crepidotus variabilis]